MLDNKQSITGNTTTEDTECDGQCRPPPYDPTFPELATFAELARPRREFSSKVVLRSFICDSTARNGHRATQENEYMDWGTLPKWSPQVQRGYRAAHGINASVSEGDMWYGIDT